MKRISLILIFCVTGAASAQAQELERFLIPIASGGIPGANGSLWETELWYRNDSGIPITLMPANVEWPSPEGGVTRQIESVARLGGRGFFFAAPAEAADGVRFNLRIRDVSRRHETWGTEIPVVRERDFFASRLTLLNVTTEATFRLGLRVYESASASQGRGPASARITIHPNEGDEVLAVTDVDLTNLAPAYFLPGYAQILSLTDAFPAIRAAGRVRVEITPLTPGARIWAFVSVTHNETQHVTTITP